MTLRAVPLPQKPDASPKSVSARLRPLIEQYATTLIVSLGCFVAVLLTVLRLPGTWLIVAGVVVAGWASGWESVSISRVVLLTGVAVGAEIFEFFASVITARKAGGSRQAAWGGLVGGILGMVFLSLPFFIVGTFIGAILGCFLGAFIVELAMNKRLAEGTKVGLFSALGLAIGTAAKIGFALVMSGIVVWTFWPAAPSPVTG